MTLPMIISAVLTTDNPLALVALVSVVAMLVVAQCVRYFFLAFSKKEDK